MIHKGIFPIIRRRAAAGFFCLLMLLSCHTAAAAGTTENIEALLIYIEQSECTFIRNGKQYDAFEARQHIEKKYAYFKDRVTSAEDFIHYSATKSSITGQPYRVICNGENMLTADWLKAELAELKK